MDKRVNEYFKEIYHFIVHDDSIWSWLVNILLAFLIVKFMIYPVLALVLGSQLPLVAVISGSMEHNGQSFDEWWIDNGDWYVENGITKEMFNEYRFTNGFNKGDVIVLVGEDNPMQGDVLVYKSSTHSYPIIHRVTYINDEGNTFQFKGDNNAGIDPADVNEEQLIGKALLKIPYIGWIKIWFSQLIGM